MRLGTHLPAFGISALVHAVILALVLTANSLMHRWFEPPQRVLPISLSMFTPAPVRTPAPPPVATPPTQVDAPPPPPKPQPRAKPVVQPKTPPKPTPKPPTAAPFIASAAEPRVETPAPQTPPQEPAHPAPAAPPPVDREQVRSAEQLFKSALRSAIEAHKHYPAQARRLRQEGQVEVEFTLQRNGELHGIRVISSSGSELLDEAAVEAVRSIDGKLPFPAEITRSEWTFSLPLTYALR